MVNYLLHLTTWPSSDGIWLYSRKENSCEFDSLHALTTCTCIHPCTGISSMIQYTYNKRFTQLSRLAGSYVPKYMEAFKSKGIT